MLGFGGEKYTREKYEGAESELESAKKANAEATPEDRRSYGREMFSNRIVRMESGPSNSPFFPDRFKERVAYARHRLKQLIESGEKEAHKLNEEYERLLEAVRNSPENALRRFESEQ